MLAAEQPAAAEVAVDIAVAIDQAVQERRWMQSWLQVREDLHPVRDDIVDDVAVAAECSRPLRLVW